MRPVSRALLALSLVIPGVGPAENRDSPLTSCATCHEEQSSSQPQTPMARAMWRPETDPAFQKKAAFTFSRDGYQWRVERHGASVTYAVSHGKETAVLPVHWIFGDSTQTYVLEVDHRFYESRVSYFAPIDGLDITPGDETDRLLNLGEAIGRELHPRELQACFGCHSTGAVVDGELEIASSSPGLQCVHCHTGVEQHQYDIARGKLASIPPKLGHMATEDVSDFCGQCHRTWGEVVRRRAFGLADVRFQPYRLAKSRCYDGSDPRISCIACHDPHVDVITNDATYESKCLACHAATANGGAARAKTCPVSPTTGCIGCHMPKTNLPPTHRAWTDHYIRVVKAGEAFPE